MPPDTNVKQSVAGWWWPWVRPVLLLALYGMILLMEVVGMVASQLYLASSTVTLFFFNYSLATGLLGTEELQDDNLTWRTAVVMAVRCCILVTAVTLHVQVLVVLTLSQWFTQVLYLGMMYALVWEEEEEEVEKPRSFTSRLYM